MNNQQRTSYVSKQQETQVKRVKKIKSEKERSVRAGLIETNDWAGRVTRGISLRDSDRSEYGKKHTRTQRETCARSRCAESAPTPDPEQGSLLSFCLFQYPILLLARNQQAGLSSSSSQIGRLIINPACLPDRKK